MFLNLRLGFPYDKNYFVNINSFLTYLVLGYGDQLRFLAVYRFEISNM